MAESEKYTICNSSIPIYNSIFILTQQRLEMTGQVLQLEEDMTYAVVHLDRCRLLDTGTEA